MSDDLSLAVLIEIRDGIRATNQRVDVTNSKLEQLGFDLRGEIAQTRDELRGEIAQLGTHLRGEILAVELRNATRVTEQTAATRDLYTLLNDRLDLRDRVTQVELDVAEIKSTLKKPRGSS